MEIGSDVNRMVTSKSEVFSVVHTRVGTPQIIIMISDVLTKAETPHTYTGRSGHLT